jgi:hypothetical protein
MRARAVKPADRVDGLPLDDGRLAPPDSGRLAAGHGRPPSEGRGPAPGERKIILSRETRHSDPAATGVPLDTMALDSLMPPKRLKSLKSGLLGGALLAVAACAPVHSPQPSVSDLLEDRVLLDGIILKCNSDLQMSRNDPQCSTARIAIARLAAASEADGTEARQAGFERRREQLRQEQDKQRLAQESAQKLDAYSMPVVPVDPGPAAVGPAAPAAAPGADHAASQPVP